MTDTVVFVPAWNEEQNLPAVLDDLKDNHPERWDALLTEMCRWLPEYDYILFDKPQQGSKRDRAPHEKGEPPDSRKGIVAGHAGRPDRLLNEAAGNLDEG